MRRFIASAGEKAKSVLISLFECELAYVNTDHPDYIGMQRAWKEHMSAKEGTHASDSDSVDGRNDRARHGHTSQALTVPRAGHHVRPWLSRVSPAFMIPCPHPSGRFRARHVGSLQAVVVLS